VLPTWAAEIFAVLLHHRIEDLKAGMDTQIEEGVFDTRERSQHRERNFYECGLGWVDELEMFSFLGMLAHGGGSFVGLVTPSVPHGG
jgi:hypothetical protein